MSRWKTIYKFTWVLIIVVCVIGVICVFLPQYAEYRQRKRKLAQYEEDIKFEKGLEKQYRENQERLADDRSFMIEVLRENGRVMTNESVIRLAPDKPSKNSSSEAPEAPQH